MEKYQCLSQIKSLLSKNFKIKEESYVLNRKLNLYGVWSEEFGRTFLTKNTVIDKYECNEHCFVTTMEILDEEKLRDFIDYLKKCSLELVKPHRDHKTTYITGIIIGDRISKNIMKQVKRFNYTKNYMFSLYGWSILRLIVIDVETSDTYYNKAATELVEKLSFAK